MATALRQPFKGKKAAPREKNSDAAPANSAKKTKNKKQDSWEMTAAEALRVNFVDSEL